MALVDAKQPLATPDAPVVVTCARMSPAGVVAGCGNGPQRRIAVCSWQYAVYGWGHLQLAWVRKARRRHARARSWWALVGCSLCPQCPGVEQICERQPKRAGGGQLAVSIAPMPFRESCPRQRNTGLQCTKEQRVARNRRLPGERSVGRAAERAADQQEHGGAADSAYEGKCAYTSNTYSHPNLQRDRVRNAPSVARRIWGLSGTEFPMESHTLLTVVNDELTSVGNTGRHTSTSFPKRATHNASIPPDPAVNVKEDRHVSGIFWCGKMVVRSLHDGFEGLFFYISGAASGRNQRCRAMILTSKVRCGKEQDNAVV
ncbi:hypothetical protein B0H19DRAFT_1057153 [Mycena capillaripes]|nr:hypothetical protein B0H19DRAFT_1057153 [Mycena capillaripes]